jgi:hypothetical protein
MQGGFIATMDGNDLVLRDNRDIKEPRIVVGDRVTVYGRGSGLATIRTRERAIIGNRTVSEREVPEVEIVYVEIR